MGEKSKHKLGPAEGATKKDAQALIVALPDKRKETKIGDPKSGSFVYWSSMGDDLDTTMTKSLALPAGAALSADVLLRDRGHVRLRLPGGLRQ